MSMKRVSIGLLLLLIVIALVFFIAKKQQSIEDPMFLASGEYWNAQITSSALQTDSITIEYFYKGNLSELAASNDIVFSNGTANGNIAETVHPDELERAHFSIQFDGNFIQEEDKVISIVKWSDKSETLQFTPYVRK